MLFPLPFRILRWKLCWTASRLVHPSCGRRLYRTTPRKTSDPTFLKQSETVRITVCRTTAYCSESLCKILTFPGYLLTIRGTVLFCFPVKQIVAVLSFVQLEINCIETRQFFDLKSFRLGSRRTYVLVMYKLVLFHAHRGLQLNCKGAHMMVNLSGDFLASM